MTDADKRQRLKRLMVAGWIDSVCLSFAWTLVLLEVVHRYGLASAGLAGAAMLVGTAASAPVASHLSLRLGGRGLLRTASGVEAVLRVSVFAVLYLNAGMVPLVVCIAAMNVTAWTGYAGMRAEVAAIAPGPRALTWYGTGVAAVEALGAAGAALVPARFVDHPSFVVCLVVVVYVLALLPTVAVAGGSPVLRTVHKPPAVRRQAPSTPLLAGIALMTLTSAPTLLAVVLAQQMYGRSAVALVAVTFTVGSLCAPAVAAQVQRRQGNTYQAWLLCALGMVVLWPFAGMHLAVLCAAQLLSGLCMTALEGLLDATTAAEATGSVTGALARATAGRALGSAAGTAILPLAVVSFGLSTSTGAVTGLLIATVVAVSVGRFAAARGHGHTALHHRIVAGTARGQVIRRVDPVDVLVPDLRQTTGNITTSAGRRQAPIAILDRPRPTKTSGGCD